MAKYRVWVIRRRGVVLIAIAILCLIALIVGARFVLAASSAALADDESKYVLLAANTSGMRCIQSDYSTFLILPPGNTLKVQVFKKGRRTAQLVSEGITVKYALVDNTRPAERSNFWTYATRYGYQVEPNMGLSGNGIAGECVLSEDRKYYVATNIPVIPYNNDSKTLNPYQVARVAAFDNRTGEIVAELPQVILAVSDEMLCSTCHGEKNTDQEILKAHDKLSHTRLYDDFTKGILYKCADCHKDNALGLKGVPEAQPLSQAMHGFHSTKMTATTIKPQCYSCHPGPVTQCYRGVMKAEGIDCSNADCHGSMANIAETQKRGRQAWQQEVDCSNCHGEKYEVNNGMLYKNSFLLNPPNQEMADKILCTSCHNSPHAIWPSTLELDNLVPLSVQGNKQPIGNKCTVCHKGRGTVHR